MRLESNILFSNCGQPFMLDTKQFGLVQDKLCITNTKDVIIKIASLCSNNKVIHDNTNSDIFNGETIHNINVLTSFYNGTNPLQEKELNKKDSGDRINTIFNKYNDKKNGYPGANNVCFCYNSINDSIYNITIFIIEIS